MIRSVSQASLGSLGFDPVAVVHSAVVRGVVRLPAIVVGDGVNGGGGRAEELKVWRLNNPQALRRYAAARRKKRLKLISMGLRFDGLPRKRPVGKRWPQLGGLNRRDYAKQYKRLSLASTWQKAMSQFSGPTRKIQLLVADFFKVPVDCMWSNRRSAGVVWPRQVAMFLCRELTLAGSLEVGVCFGGRDHSTVLFAVARVRSRVALSRRDGAAVDFLRVQARDLLK